MFPQNTTPLRGGLTRPVSVGANPGAQMPVVLNRSTTRLA